MFGVEVQRTSLPRDVTYTRADDASGAQGKLVAPQSAVFALAPEPNSATRAINALLKTNAKISIATAAFDADGAHFASGTFLIEDASGLESLAQQDRVVIQGLKQRPQVATAKLRPVRLALYKPWVASTDEGWTRWLLEQYGFDVHSLDNKTVQAGKLNEKYDAIILPDADKDVILDGHRRAEEHAAGGVSLPRLNPARASRSGESCRLRHAGRSGSVPGGSRRVSNLAAGAADWALGGGVVSRRRAGRPDERLAARRGQARAPRRRRELHHRQRQAGAARRARATSRPDRRHLQAAV